MPLGASGVGRMCFRNARNTIGIRSCASASEQVLLECGVALRLPPQCYERRRAWPRACLLNLSPDTYFHPGVFAIVGQHLKMALEISGS